MMEYTLMLAALVELLSRIRDNRALALSGEEAVRQGVILPILGRLGWDRDDINQVVPEFSVGNGRVDYCLRIGERKKVFVEVKRANEELEQHQEQLLEYAFREGVEIAVLTNGLIWWFYLPLFQGSWEQRKYFAIDVQRQDLEGVSNHLSDFLSHGNVASGAAVQNARQIHESQAKERLIRETLSKAWEELCTEPDDLLLELFAEKVESLCGHKPDHETIARFLEGVFKIPVQSAPVEKKNSTPSKVAPRPHPVSTDRKRYTFSKAVSYTFRGKTKSVRSFRQILTGLCTDLWESHSGNFDRVLGLEGRARPYFSREANKLRHPFQIGDSGIFIETNMNANNIVDRCNDLIALFGYSLGDFKVEVEGR